MQKLISTTLALAILGAPAIAEGDAAKGEKTFRKCKSCHMIKSPDGEQIAKGGRTGPNLWGLPGKTAGTVDGYKYGKSIVEAGAAGLVWDEAQFVAYVANPKGFLAEYLEATSAKSKMSFKLKKEADAKDVWAYLVSVAPAE